MAHIQIASDVEFKIDINLDDISETSRDWNVQQHKAEIYVAFEKRLQQAFPEGYKINSFDFGLDINKH